MDQDYQFGLKNGKVIHASDVDSGIKCNCYCPCCGGRFIAYKGRVLRPHFKHLAGSNCKYSFETALHLFAKEIIQKKKFIDLPHLDWEIPAVPSSWFTRDAGDGAIPPLQKIDFQRVYFDKVEVEKWEGNFKPDLKCFVGDKQLLIEITVTHGIDENKVKKIKSNDIPLLEIDLSGLQHQINKKTLSRVLYTAKEALHTKSQTFRWIHNPKQNKRCVQQQEKSNRIFDFLNQNRKPVKMYGRNKKVYNCPLLHKSGAPYNFADTCEFCNYNLGKIEVGKGIEIANKQRDWAVMCIGHKKYELELLFKACGAKTW